MPKVDNTEYDPYFILDITRDSSDAEVTKAYKKKVKRYHPDKLPKNTPESEYIRAEHMYRVVNECFKEIMSNRGYGLRSQPATTFEPQEMTDLSKFNKEFEDKMYDHPNDFGYGDHHHISTVEEYDQFEPQYVNQFKDKKFSREEFNRVFEYNKQQEPDEDESSKALQLHRTSDGFVAAAGADIGAAPVSSFNGLLLVGDEYGQSGVGYYGDGYSDYRQVHRGTANPQMVQQVPGEFVSEEKKFRGKNIEKELLSQQKRRMENTMPNAGTYKEGERQMYQQQISQLQEQEATERERVMRYANKMYDQNTLSRALEGRLDQSQRLLPNLGGFFKTLEDA